MRSPVPFGNRLLAGLRRLHDASESTEQVVRIHIAIKRWRRRLVRRAMRDALANPQNRRVLRELAKR